MNNVCGKFFQQEPSIKINYKLEMYLPCTSGASLNCRYRLRRYMNLRWQYENIDTMITPITMCRVKELKLIPWQAIFFVDHFENNTQSHGNEISSWNNWTFARNLQIFNNMPIWPFIPTLTISLSKMWLIKYHFSVPLLITGANMWNQIDELISEQATPLPEFSSIC